MLVHVYIHYILKETLFPFLNRLLHLQCVYVQKILLQKSE